jgi:hypothetical protein
MKLPDVSGVFDYAGLTRDSRYRPRHVAFHQIKSVGVLIASFRSSIPSPPVPLFTLRRAPHDAQRKTRGRVVRYSFLVGLLHSLLHAGLSRRTDSAILRQLSGPQFSKLPAPRRFAAAAQAYPAGHALLRIDHPTDGRYSWPGTRSFFPSAGRRKTYPDECPAL